ncbi:hypothetical protein DSO57_1027536 [Entomophthora muscae]|uniref:Uncharacterized protein n=1 Tax=Entomophthora muscae TaxID=34485 RepID=A0ACC2RSV6_9FUNG|nr:hypothetical protein DSO57_1027536 [Entomophthora muscae]
MCAILSKNLFSIPKIGIRSHYPSIQSSRGVFQLPDFKKVFGSNPTNTDSDTLIYSQKKVLPHSPIQVFDVIANIEKYPEFLPYCTGAKIHSQISESEITRITASLSIGFSAFNEAYTSNVILQSPRIIKIQSNNSSLFKTLTSNWVLLPDNKSGGCQVNFDLNFVPHSSLYASVSRLYFSEISASMIEAFEKRCKSVYM